MNNKNHKAVSNCLSKYRKARGLSQVEVARILGLKSSAHVCRWEHGRCWPSAVNLLNLAALYEVPVDWLYADALQLLRTDMRLRAAAVLRAVKCDNKTARRRVTLDFN